VTGVAFDVRGLSAGHPHARPISVDLDLTVERGSFVAIIGPNACGKSTLLRTVARLLPALAGTVLLDGRDIRERGAKELARELGLLSQSAEAPDGMRVADLIARGRYPHRRAFAAWNDADESAVRTAMERTSVVELADRVVDELSGGQRQRVWLAMALAQETDVLLLDEPTTFLDITHQLDMLDLFRSVNREHGTTIVAVLHDLNQAARYADRIVAMRDGAILATGTPDEVLTPAVMKRVFDLDCRIIPDPETGTPMVVPARR
jgi:ABC-type cobalamin/Fe3+-siderophores transport system ATPase subunit